MARLSLGWGIFAAAIAGLGILSLASGDFAGVWQPVPGSLPAREFLAYANGVLMCALGLGLLAGRSARLAAAVVTLYLLVWLIALHVPMIIAAPDVEDNWAGLGENSTLIAGGWILFASLTAPDRGGVSSLVAGARGIRAARLLFGVALPFMALDELLYVKATADLVPVWLPLRSGWAYLTGAAQMATALGILLRICPRLATTLQALMFSIFTLLVWVPRATYAPGHRLDWTALLISSALSGGAWIVAESYRNASWRELPGLRAEAASGPSSTSIQAAPASRKW